MLNDLGNIYPQAGCKLLQINPFLQALKDIEMLFNVYHGRLADITNEHDLEVAIFVWLKKNCKNLNNHIEDQNMFTKKF